MITFLDLIIIVSMVLIAASFLSVALMFLIKNKKVQHICFYAAAVLGVYMGFVGITINWPGFMGQAVVAAVAALAGIGAVVLERAKKNDDRMFLYTRIMASASLIIGAANALLI